MYKEQGYVKQEGEKSIHSRDSIRFSTEVVGIGDWQRKVLEQGLKLEFEKEPGKYRERNNQSAVQNMAVLKDKVAEWIEQGHVERIAEPAWCTNPMTVAVKYDPVKDEVKMRPCIDLSRHVNKCLKQTHVKMDDLTVAEELISPGDFMASFDLANQFFHVQLHPEDRKYFGFALPTEDGKEEFFQFKVMAYGFSPAVGVVTRLLRPVKAFLHDRGIKLSIFVDDGRVSAATEEETWEKFQFVLEIMQLCGWNIQWKKTSTEASQRLAHLGFITDSVQMRYFLPVEKEEAVVKLLGDFVEKGLKAEKVSSLSLASLLGKLNSMRRSHGSMMGVMSRSCNHVMGETVLKQGWHSSLLLSWESVRELQFLLENVRQLNGQHIVTQEARSKVIELKEADRLVEKIKLSDDLVQNLFVSDASDAVAFVYKADGTFLSVREFQFSAEERDMSSGMRELLAVKKMLEEESGQFKKHRGGKVYWQTDSMNSYIFLSRGSRKPSVQEVVADIKLAERSLDVQIVPVWTPRTHSRLILADLGSKIHTSTDEWCIDRDRLAEVFLELDFQPEVDCCATRYNAVCGKFFSKIPQVGTAGVNFLSQNLQEGIQYYCCPPVKMIGRATCHLLEKKNIVSVLIVPKWVSTAFWSALTDSEKFRKAVRKEISFRTTFFMSNGAVSLFTKCKSMEMSAFLLKS